MTEEGEILNENNQALPVLEVGGRTPEWEENGSRSLKQKKNKNKKSRRSRSKEKNGKK